MNARASGDFRPPCIEPILPRGLPTLGEPDAERQPNRLRFRIPGVPATPCYRPAVDVPPDRITHVQWPGPSYWVRSAAAVLVTIALFVALRRLEHVIVLVLLSLVLAVGLEPWVEALDRIKIRRGFGVFIIFLAVVAVVVGFLILVGPRLVREIQGLGRDLPRILADLSKSGGLVNRVFGDVDLNAELQKFISDLPSNLTSSLGTFIGAAGKVTEAVFSLLTVAILTVYFMASLPSMRHNVAGWFPRSERERWEQVLNRSMHRIGRYVSGLLIQSAISAVATGIFLIVIGIDFAVPLALWAGAASIIPIVGAYLGGIPAVIVAFSVSPGLGIATVVFFVAWQQFRDYVISPRVMSGAVNLSPAAVIVASLAGATLAGFAGVLLALPVAATIKEVMQEFRRRDEDDQESEEASPARPRSV